MKKSMLFLVAAIVVATSCSVREDVIEPKVSEQEITITATREGDETQTRTYRDDSDMSIWWIPGDAISLFYGSGTNGGSKFTSVNTTDTTKVTNFTGVITAITGGGEIAVDQTYFWGLYPYQEDASCDGTSVTMTLPKEQTAVPGTFATNTFPSIGRSQGLIMGFYNICSGMKFSVTKEGIKKVTFKSRNGELLTGKAKVSFDNGVPAAEIIDGSDEVVLEAPAGEYFEPGKYYFLVFFPTKFTNGFTVTFETFTEEAVYERTGSMTANRSRFGTISNIDASATYSKKTGNIPVEDANFKAYLIENFDGNGDGEISYEEAASITSIEISTGSIRSVQGIEFMDNLTSLNCNRNQLTSLDVSNNTALTNLLCFNNQLTNLDVSSNTALTLLSCYNNQLTSLDVSNNTALTNLSCYNNQLTSLVVSNNTALAWLNCGDNQLTAVDVSKNTALTFLSCNSNQLTSLDVSNNTELTYLSCYNNRLPSLDVSTNTVLTSLYCTGNQLTSLDVSNNTALTYLYCYGNQLTSLDVSNNAALTNLRCHGNQLTNLDVSNNTALTYLSCYLNLLTSLDVSNNTALTSLDCNRNLLTALDISKNTALTYLAFFSNQLTSLDVSNNTALTTLWCDRNQLTSLDVSNNTALTTLRCDKNQLTSLDVSNNTALTSLYCTGNQLTSLDVSNNTALRFLICSPMNDSNGNNLLKTLYIYQGQEIPNVTADRSEENIPAETQIVVAPENGGGEGTGEDDWGDANIISFSSANGDYIYEYWTSGFGAARYNVNVPNVNESQPDNCIYQNDINAPFVTYPRSNEKSGKLAIDGIESATYSFDKTRMEAISLIGNKNVRFRVGEGGDELYASILSANGSVLVAEELVARIHNEPIYSGSYCIWNAFTFEKGGSVSGQLLNTGEMYVYLKAKVLFENGSVYRISYDGDDSFRANIIMPISIAEKSIDKFIDAVYFGEKGSYIKIEDVLDITDWRGRAFSKYSNYWGFYGPFDVSLDLGSAQCDINGTLINIPSTIILTQTVPESTSIPDPVTGNSVILPSNSYGYLTYKNNGTNVTSDYNIYIKAIVNYGFGPIHTDWITIPVDKTIGQ